MKLNFAKRMSYIKASEIREILKVTEQEDVISFAGGLPAPELFPIDEINEINQIVLKEAGTKALQYTTTEGYAFFPVLHIYISFNKVPYRIIRRIPWLLMTK